MVYFLMRKDYRENTTKHIAEQRSQFTARGRLGEIESCTSYSRATLPAPKRG